MSLKVLEQAQSIHKQVFSTESNKNLSKYSQKMLNGYDDPLMLIPSSQLEVDKMEEQDSKSVSSKSDNTEEENPAIN